MKAHTCIFAVVLAIGCTTAQAQGPAVNRPIGQGAQRQQLDIVAHEQGIPAAAAAAGGHYVGTEMADVDLAVSSVSALVAYSDVVVLGRPVSQRSLLSDDQKHINTEYDLRVERVFFDRGRNVPIKKGSTLKINLPGGKLAFADGKSAETRADGFEMMQQGQQYLLFLERIEDPRVAAIVGTVGTYRLAFGSQGLYGVFQKQGTATPGVALALKPAGRPNAPLAQQLMALSGDPFVQIEKGVAEGARMRDARRSGVPR